MPDTQAKPHVRRNEGNGDPYPHSLWLGDDFVCVLSDQQADVIEAALNPAADLPEGVAVAADGRMYAPGDVVRTFPDGEWERRVSGGEAWMTDTNPNAVTEWFYEVRRRPTPRTERVEWHEARGRRLPGGGVVSQVKETFDLPHGGYLVGATEWFPADPDGMVTVLTEDVPR